MIALLCTLSALAADAPPGWLIAGSDPEDYATTVDRRQFHGGAASARLESTTEHADGFGTLMQKVDATPYRGQRVRLSAWVAADAVDDWAGVWMRVDAGREVTAFDNMQERPIQGTSPWRSYEVVLDVAPDATSVAFGILISGRGTTWIDDCRLEVVDASVAVTGGPIASRPPGVQNATPLNLGFEGE